MRVPPQDPAVEELLVGACLITARARNEVLDVVTEADFLTEASKVAFASIIDLHQHGEPVNPGTVAVRSGLRAADLAAVMARTPSSAGARLYAQQVAELATRRRLLGIAGAIADVGYDTSAPLAKSLEAAAQSLADVAIPSLRLDPDPGIDVFLAEQDHVDWLVPHMLERHSRMILTGYVEGGGKSTFLRQFGLQCAAGIVPFSDHRTMRPIRVLYVDAENPRGIIQREIRPMRVKAGVAIDDPTRLVMRCRPEGLDLLAARDQAWLHAVIDADRPDLLIMGPLYKLSEADPNKEEPARKLAAFLDRLRIRYGFALMLEAHTPQASGGEQRTLRPYGASLWRRWPEIGMGIAKTEFPWFELVEWRGTRGGRGAWPREIAKASSASDWPWDRIALNPEEPV